MLAFCAFEHLIFAFIAVAGQMSDIGYIHDAHNIVSEVIECSDKRVLHYVCTKVSYVCKMIYRRTAGVHFHLARFVCEKFVFCSCDTVI